MTSKHHPRYVDIHKTERACGGAVRAPVGSGVAISADRCRRLRWQGSSPAGNGSRWRGCRADRSQAVGGVRVNGRDGRQRSRRTPTVATDVAAPATCRAMRRGARAMSDRTIATSDAPGRYGQGANIRSTTCGRPASKPDHPRRARSAAAGPTSRRPGQALPLSGQALPLSGQALPSSGPTKER